MTSMNQGPRDDSFSNDKGGGNDSKKGRGFRLTTINREDIIRDLCIGVGGEQQMVEGKGLSCALI